MPRRKTQKVDPIVSLAIDTYKYFAQNKITHATYGDFEAGIGRNIKPLTIKVIAFMLNKKLISKTNNHIVFQVNKLKKK